MRTRYNNILHCAVQIAVLRKMGSTVVACPRLFEMTEVSSWLVELKAKTKKTGKSLVQNDRKGSSSIKFR